MPNVYLPGLVQIRPQVFNGGVDENENVLWYLGSLISGYTEAMLTTIQTAFNTGWTGVWEAYGVNTGEYQGAIVTDWSSDTGLTVGNTGFAEVAGPHTGDQGAQVAALISWQTFQRYRGGHSRSYLPGVASSVLNGATTLSPTVVANIGLAITALNADMAAISGASGGPLLQRVFRFKENADKAALIAIANSFVNPVLATQRRRLRKVSRR